MRSAVGLGLALAASLTAGAARAEAPFTLAWEAPSGCPSESAVTAQVMQHAGAIDPRGGSHVRARARVERVGATYRVELTTHVGDEEGTRTLAAPTCAALADATAVVLALLLALRVEGVVAAPQPGASSGAPATTPAPQSSASNGAPPPPQSSASSGATPPPQSSASSGATPPPQSSASSGATPQPSANDGAMPASQNDGAPTPSAKSGAPASQKPVANAASSPRRANSAATRASNVDAGRERFAVALATTGDAGSLPALAAGVFGAIAWRPGALSLELGASYFPGASAELGAAGGRIDLVAAEIHGAYTFTRGRLSVAPCAAVEVGRMGGAGFGVLAPASDGAAWIALSPGGLATLAIARPFALRLGIDAVFPLNRATFVLDGVGRVHQASPVAARATLGVELRFR